MKSLDNTGHILTEFTNKAISSAGVPNGVSGTAAILSSVLEFDGMTREDAVNYAESLGQTINEMRAQNIPIIWAGINSEMGNKAFVPEGNAGDEKRSIAQLRQSGFMEDEESYDNYDVLESFIVKYGPQANEAMFRKAFMSALTEPTDIEHDFRQEHQEELLKQAGVLIDNENRGETPKGFRKIKQSEADTEFLKLFNNDKTLSEYLRENNVQNTLIMGQVARYCNLETAVSAEEKGFNPSIVGDRCLSWMFGSSPKDGTPMNTCVWESAVNKIGIPFVEKVDHTALMQVRLSEIAADEAYLRGMSEETALNIQAIPIIKASDVMDTQRLNNNVVQKLNNVASAP
jgi:nicotinamidase-related amidase